MWSQSLEAEDAATELIGIEVMAGMTVAVADGKGIQEVALD